MAEMRERHRALHRHTKPQKIAHLSDRKSTNNLAMQLRKVAGDPTSTSVEQFPRKAKNQYK